MAQPTERAVKRKPMAVIMLTTLRKDAPVVPPKGRDFEWFESKEGMTQFFDQVHAFNEQDAKDHDDMAYLTVEITDTDAMKIGRVKTAPENKEWAKTVKDDITVALKPEKESGEGSGKTKAVKPRKKSSAAKAVQKGTPKKKGTPDAKAARLKERLAAKQPEKKSETGDKAPPKRKATTKKEKVSAASEAGPDTTTAVVDQQSA